MPIGATLLTSGTDNDLNASATTASISPTANRLVLAAVARTNFGADQTPTVAGSGLTWVQVAHTIVNTGALHTLTLFRAMSSGPGSGALTIQLAGAQDTILWSIVEFDTVISSGVDGANAIVQSNLSVSSGGTNATLTLGNFGNASNAVYSTTLTDNTTHSKDATFTELHNITDANTYLRLSTQFLASNDTAPYTSLGAANAWGIIALELAFSGAAAGSFPGFKALQDCGR